MARNSNDIIMEGVRLLFMDFTGTVGPFNKTGDKSFCVVLPPDLADQLRADGFNVKQTKPREEGDEVLDYVKIKVNFAVKPPKIWMLGDTGRTHLNNDTVELLDSADIVNVDLIASPYDYEIAGTAGKSLYVDTMYVTIKENYLDRKYAQYEQTEVGTSD